jgi:hypothetical protein
VWLRASPVENRESWLLKVVSSAQRNRAVLFAYAFEARSPRLPSTSSHPLLHSSVCRCTLRTPEYPRVPPVLPVPRVPQVALACVRACRGADWLSAFACKNRFEPLLCADPNQPVSVAAGRCTARASARAGMAYAIMAHTCIDRATLVSAKMPPRKSGCANKQWHRSLHRRKSRPRPAADGADIHPRSAASRSLRACASLRALAAPAVPCSIGPRVIRQLCAARAGACSRERVASIPY